MMRRYRKPRCLTGQRHFWTLGAAQFADDDGTLRSSPTRAHLKGTCKKCFKARVFHPHAARDAADRAFRVRGHVTTAQLAAVA